MDELLAKFIIVHGYVQARPRFITRISHFLSALSGGPAFLLRLHFLLNADQIRCCEHSAPPVLPAVMLQASSSSAMNWHPKGGIDQPCLVPVPMTDRMPAPGVERLLVETEHPGRSPRHEPRRRQGQEPVGSSSEASRGQRTPPSGAGSHSPALAPFPLPQLTQLRRLTARDARADAIIGVSELEPAVQDSEIPNLSRPGSPEPHRAGDHGQVPAELRGEPSSA